jgi:glutaredoxin
VLLDKTVDQGTYKPVRKRVDLKVDILYIDGCPSKNRVEKLVQQILDELGVSGAQVSTTMVSTYAQAESIKFVGSPTIRINDVDIEPDTDRLTEFGLNPRTYKVKGMEQDMPDLRLLKDAVRKAKKDEEEKALVEREKIDVATFDAKPLPRKYGMSTFKTTKAPKKKSTKKKAKGSEE